MIESERLTTLGFGIPNLLKIGKVYLCKGNFNPSKNKNLQLTEAEIKKDFEWAWQFAKEVN